MAKYLLDTGVLLHYVRGSTLALLIDNQYSPTELPNYPVVSVVSIGEMRSFAFRLKWGQHKLDALNKLLNSIPSVDISHPSILSKFAEMDAYRFGKHPDKHLPSVESVKILTRRN